MPVTIELTHEWYGCETGCCGHALRIKGDDQRMFFMEHRDDDETAEDFARRLVKEATDPPSWLMREVHAAGGYELGKVEAVSHVECTW